MSEALPTTPEAQGDMEPRADTVQLCAEATAKGLWLFNAYTGVWLAPHELLDRQRRGMFRWGSPNFEQRSPLELLDQLERDREKLTAEIDRVRRRMIPE